MRAMCELQESVRQASFSEKNIEREFQGPSRRLSYFNNGRRSTHNAVFVLYILRGDTIRLWCAQSTYVATLSHL
jgi:hypothetical protein